MTTKRKDRARVELHRLECELAEAVKRGGFRRFKRELADPERAKVRDFAQFWTELGIPPLKEAADSFMEAKTHMRRTMEQLGIREVRL